MRMAASPLVSRAMKARDVMTSKVVSVLADTPAREVAELLLENHISAVPVVDRDGAPIGMVSEGDLIGRDEADRVARRDWWLALLAEGETLSSDFLTSLHAPARTARDIMAGPVVTIDEDTEVAEIARLLATYRIKRVPVVRDGRMVGIVSRADLLRALVAEEPKPAAARGRGLLAGALAELDQHFLHRRDSAAKPSAPAASRRSDEAGLMAHDFQRLAADFQHQELQHHEEERRAAAEERRHRVSELIDDHISDESWRALLHGARQAAERGQNEFMLLRFPSQLCTDGGRAINVTEPGWPATLRGEAAETYLRWQRELKPQGFHLAARVLDFPGGKPGDIGLFLVWGQ